jgi:SAM-dependent methyltransferase
MLKRWKSAQKAEKIYWDSEKVVFEETCAVLERYSKVFSEIDTCKDWRVLDIGCGPTVVSRLIEGGEKFGVDPLMRYFTSKFGASLFSLGFNFLVGVGEFLPFKNGCFDLVVCRNVLDHVEFPEIVLQEIRRVARSSGFLVLGVYVYPEFVCRLKQRIERLGVIGLKEEFHPYFFTREALEDMLSRHFLVVEKRVVFWDRACWERIVGKLLNVMRMEGRSFSVLSQFRFFFSCLVFSLFWNVVRFLNRFKSGYYVSEQIFVACFGA